MSFFSKKPKESLNLIMDIQSSVVRASLVQMREGDLPHIVWTSAIVIPYRMDGGSSYLIDLTVKAIGDLSLAAKTFVHDARAHSGTLPSRINRVHCVLSSPWIVSQARTVSQIFDKNTKVTRAYVHEIIKKERADMSAKTDDRMISIEEKIFDVRLNGYSIPEWNGAAGRNFEVSFAVSLAGTHMIKRFVEAAKRSGVSGSHIDFHSSLLLQHIGLGGVLPIPGPHMLIHVHGELTDIVVSTGQTCVLFGSHPTGIRTVIRTLAKDMNVPENAADSALSLFETGQSDPLHGGADAEHIRAAMTGWSNDCLKVTSMIPAHYQPARAMISARFHEEIFKNTFASAYPAIKTEVLPAEKLYTLATFDPQVEKLRLTILYVIAIHSLEMV
jgi:hypothetical protein